MIGTGKDSPLLNEQIPNFSEPQIGNSKSDTEKLPGSSDDKQIQSINIDDDAQAPEPEINEDLVTAKVKL